MSKSTCCKNGDLGQNFIRKGSGKLTMPEPKIIKWLDIVAKSLAIAQAAWALFEKILG